MSCQVKEEYLPSPLLNLLFEVTAPEAGFNGAPSRTNGFEHYLLQQAEMPSSITFFDFVV